MSSFKIYRHRKCGLQKRQKVTFWYFWGVFFWHDRNTFMTVSWWNARVEVVRKRFYVHLVWSGHFGYQLNRSGSQMKMLYKTSESWRQPSLSFTLSRAAPVLKILHIISSVDFFKLRLNSSDWMSPFTGMCKKTKRKMAIWRYVIVNMMVLLFSFELKTSFDKSLILNTICYPLSTQLFCAGAYWTNFCKSLWQRLPITRPVIFPGIDG